MNIKNGVKVEGIQPEMMIALMCAQQAYEQLGCRQSFVLTSCTDSAPDRVEDSKHPPGYAIDLRTRGVGPMQQEWLRDLIEQKLTHEYTVLLEEDHIHIHFNL